MGYTDHGAPHQCLLSCSAASYLIYADEWLQITMAGHIPQATFSTVNAALKAGINFFDTAEMYVTNSPHPLRFLFTREH